MFGAAPAHAATFTATGTPGEARGGALAALLADGRVLVASGNAGASNNNIQLLNSNSFSPATATWTDANTLNYVHDFGAGAPLESGKYLAVGGHETSPADTDLATAELYTPGTNHWDAVGNMGSTQARRGHTATLLGDGRVAVIGGWGANPLQTRVFNPATNLWTMGHALATERYAHTATMLADGTVLVAGGAAAPGPDGAALTSAELYGPRGDTMTSAGDMTTARSDASATLLQDGRVLVAGGTDADGNPVASAELYDPATTSWSPAGHLATARSRHAAVLLRNGRVLVTGGLDAGGTAVASTEIYNPATNSWSAGPAMDTARYDHSATTLVDGRVLVAGGFDNSGAIDEAELLAPAPVPSAAARRPVIAYVDPAGHFQLYDSETGHGLPVPPLPAGLSRFAMSPDGRYVVYVDPTALTIHLYDRNARAELPLPGIDVDADPGNPTVSDNRLIAFDHNSNGPTRVYSADSKSFVDTGLAADNGHRQPHLSADGRYLATTCISGCVSDTGGDSDAFVQDLSTKQPVPFPDDLSAPAKSEEHPCIDGSGSLVGVNIPHPSQEDVFVYDRDSGQLVPVSNSDTLGDVRCQIDARGNDVALEDENSGDVRLYDRLAGAEVPLPAAIAGPFALSEPRDLTPPKTTILSAPGARTTLRDVTLTFASSEPGSTFECSVDGKAFAPCRSPRKLHGLGLGRHSFAVRATDPSGNTDLTPAMRSWKVVATAELSDLSVKPKALYPDRAGGSLGTATTKKKLHRGATVRFRLSADARAVFKVQRRRRVDGALKWVKLPGKVTLVGTIGLNRTHFSGRWKGTPLPAGQYRLLARPVPGPKKGALQRTPFTVKRRKTKQTGSSR